MPNKARKTFRISLTLELESSNRSNKMFERQNRFFHGPYPNQPPTVSIASATNAFVSRYNASRARTKFHTFIFNVVNVVLLYIYANTISDLMNQSIFTKNRHRAGDISSLMRNESITFIKRGYRSSSTDCARTYIF